MSQNEEGLSMSDNEYQIVGVKGRPTFCPTAITGLTRSYVLGLRTLITKCNDAGSTYLIQAIQGTRESE